jgi:hypothetical protein
MLKSVLFYNIHSFISLIYVAKSNFILYPDFHIIQQRKYLGSRNDAKEGKLSGKNCRKLAGATGKW